MIKVPAKLVEVLVASYETAFGREEAVHLMNVWQSLGYKKFTEMPEQMQWDFFKYFSEVLFDAKRLNENGKVCETKV